MKACLASGIAFSLVTLGTLQAQVVSPEDQPPAVSAAVESNVFTVLESSSTAGPTENGWVRLDRSGDGSQFMQQLRERLKDPEQRVLLRAEQRADLVQSHWGVGRALGIDAATESALIELLADQRMERLDWVHLRMASAPLARNSAIHDEAAQQTRGIEAQRALLGEQRLEQYQAFEKTLGERSQVRLLDSRLDPAHKLTREQTEQLVQLYRAHNARRMNERPSLGMLQGLRTSRQTLPSPEDLRRSSQLMMVVSNEDLWRRAAGNNRALTEQATAILTAPQLATLSQIQTEQANQLQQRVEQLRTQAGLSPQIPAVPDIPLEAAPARIERNGDAKVSIRLSIDGKEPTVSSQIVRNGGVVTFDVGDGMFVEATPRLFDDGMYDLRVTYHEAGRTGRRLIGEMREYGDFTQQSVSDALALSGSGGSGTVIIGRKAYAVELDARVEAM